MQILVQDMMKETRTDWDVTKLNEWVDPENIVNIQKIKICSTAEEDLLAGTTQRIGSTPSNLLIGFLRISMKTKDLNHPLGM